jgi:beta-lactamase class A
MDVILMLSLWLTGAPSCALESTFSTCSAETIMISRRSFLQTGSLVALAAATPARAFPAASRRHFASLPESLAQLEKRSMGRLGVAVLDTASGETSGHRADERFAMCSTFKVLLAAAVLHRVDAHVDGNQESLDRTLPMPAQFLFNSPVTQPHAGGRMTLGDLCAAALTRSDNTAANLLLATIDGPAGLTRFARSLGDPVTRLDRVETALNQALPGDPRDTTSPAAMVADWRTLLLGSTLSFTSRKRLTDWLIANRTGGDRLRAGLPAGWLVGDKTGSNGDTTTNDVAILWPKDQPPVLIAAYLTECPGPEAKRSAVLAEVGRLVANALQST